MFWLGVILFCLICWLGSEFVYWYFNSEDDDE